MPRRLLFAATLALCTFVYGADDDDRQRVVYKPVQIVELRIEGAAEKAMLEYQRWLNEPAGGVPLGEDVSFDKLSPAQQARVQKLMAEMYKAAGGGSKAFKAVAKIIDKGLESPSKTYTERGYSTEPIPNKLSILMAEAREAMIEKVILELGEQNGWKVGRSDSGNTTSGMKSDLDQTFYIFQQDPVTGEWTRVSTTDRVFIEAFNKTWDSKYPDLSRDALDIASIEGRNRFPDPRAVDIEDFRDLFRTTIVELRNTPGAYTTHGAVLQQMQLRALAAIMQENKRAFQQYGPMDDGAWGKIADFDQRAALDTMFGRGLDPVLMRGLPFGAAVANFLELQHYMTADKFETKYHLRTWDDAMFTQWLLDNPDKIGEVGKLEYNKLSAAERAKYNEEFLKKLFPGNPKRQALQALALDASADLRNLHKGEFDKIPALKGKDPKALSTYDKNKAVFGELAAALHPRSYKPESTDAAQIAKNEQILRDVERTTHRKLASQFCLRTIYHTADEALGMVLALDGNDKTWIDVDKLRNQVQGPRPQDVSKGAFDAKWAKMRQNLRSANLETLLFAMWDLGPTESKRMRDFLKSKHPKMALEIDRLWVQGVFKGFTALIQHRDIYARYYKGKAARYMADINQRVRQHILSELGFEKVEVMTMVGGAFHRHQRMTWSWRKMAKNAVWDPGSLDAAAQIIRTFFESGGDVDAVMATVADEILLAVPIVGQGVSAARGGVQGLVIMGLAMKLPPVGLALLVYSLGETTYAIYDMEYRTPLSNNIADAVYRGYAGPDVIGFGEPGRPGLVWTGQLEERMAALEKQVGAIQFKMGTQAQALLQSELKQYQKQIAALRQEIAALKSRRKQIEFYGGGHWMGGTITGAAAITKQIKLDNYLLRDFDPIVGFFAKSVVDLRILSDLDPEKTKKEIAALQQREQGAADVDNRLGASPQLFELQRLLDRFEKAVKWVNLSEKYMELRYRFRKDSVYLTLKRKFGDVTDEVVNQYVNDWWLANSEAVIKDLVAKGVITEGQSGQQESWLRDQKDIQPVDKAMLQERLREDVRRSRALWKLYQKQEDQRRRVHQRNIDRARTAYGMEMARPRADTLPDFGGLLEAIRFASIPRHVPTLEATLYKTEFPAPPVEEESESQEDPEPIWSWSTTCKITADPSIYHPPYVTQTKFFTKRSASGAGALLPAARKHLPKALAAADDDDLIVLVSAYASDMVDTSKMWQPTVAHLPRQKASVDGKSMYLMAQSLSYVPMEKPKEPEPEPMEEPTGPLKLISEVDEHENTFLYVTSDEMARVDNKDKRPPGPLLVLTVERAYAPDGPFVQYQGEEPEPFYFDAPDRWVMPWRRSPIDPKRWRGRIAENRVRFLTRPPWKNKIPDAQHKPLYFRIRQEWIKNIKDEKPIGTTYSNVVGPGPLRLVYHAGRGAKKDGDTFTERGNPIWTSVNAAIGHENQGFHYWGAKMTVTSGSWTSYAWTPTQNEAWDKPSGAGWASARASSRVPMVDGKANVTITMECEAGSVSETIKIVADGDPHPEKTQARIERIKQNGAALSRHTLDMEKLANNRKRSTESLQKTLKRAQEHDLERDWMSWTNNRHSLVRINLETVARHEHITAIKRNDHELSLARAMQDIDAQFDIAMRRVDIFDPTGPYATTMLQAYNEHIQIYDEERTHLKDEKLIKSHQAHRKRYEDDREKLRPELARKQMDAYRLLYDAAVWRGDAAIVEMSAKKRFALLDEYGSQFGFMTTSRRTHESKDYARSIAGQKAKILRQLADDIANLTGNRNKARTYLEQHWEQLLQSARDEKARQRSQQFMDSGYRPAWWPDDS